MAGGLMIIKQFRLVAIWLVLLVVAPVIQASDSMRCGNSLVSVGDHKAEILIKCGEPFLQETIAVHEATDYSELALKYPLLYKHGLLRDKSGVVISSESSVSQPIDQWTYHMGSGQFLKFLIFQGGTLISIDDGERM